MRVAIKETTLKQRRAVREHILGPWVKQQMQGQNNCSGEEVGQSNLDAIVY